MPTPRIPVDTTRCQAEVPDPDHHPFLLGSVQFTRCRNVPTVIATERVAGADGVRGQMSLCDACTQTMHMQMPDHADTQPIPRASGAPDVSWEGWMLHGKYFEGAWHVWMYRMGGAAEHLVVSHAGESLTAAMERVRAGITP